MAKSLYVCTYVYINHKPLCLRAEAGRGLNLTGDELLLWIENKNSGNTASVLLSLDFFISHMFCCHGDLNDRSVASTPSWWHFIFQWSVAK